VFSEYKRHLLQVNYFVNTSSFVHNLCPFVSQMALKLKFWKPLHAINTVSEPSVPRFPLLGHIYETFLRGHWFKPKQCTGYVKERVLFNIEVF